MKKTVSAYIEGEKRISEPVSFSLDTAYSEVTVSLPLRIVDSCSLPEGTYMLVVEGLDRRVEEDIVVQQKKACSSPASQEQKEMRIPVQEKNPILSFYTLAKRFNAGQEVKLFGRVDAMSDLVLVLENRIAGEVAYVEEFGVKQAEEPVRLAFNVTLFPGENVFSLAVRDIPETKKRLVVSTDVPPGEDGTSVPALYSSLFLDDSRTYPSNKTRGFEEGSVTAHVVYERGPVKYLNILLVFVFVLAGLAVWRERKRHYAKGRHKGVSRKGVCAHTGHVRGHGKPKGARRVIVEAVSQRDKGRDTDQDDL